LVVPHHRCPAPLPSHVLYAEQASAPCNGPVRSAPTAAVRVGVPRLRTLGHSAGASVAISRRGRAEHGIETTAVDAFIAQAGSGARSAVVTLIEGEPLGTTVWDGKPWYYSRMRERPLSERFVEDCAKGFRAREDRRRNAIEQRAE